MTPVENTLTIERTGKQRDISGFPAEEYLFSWSMVLEDSQGEKMRSNLTSRTWTTPVTDEMAQAITMSKTFDQAYWKALDLNYPEAVNQVLPSDALQVVQTYLIDVLQDSDSAFISKFAALPKLEGYPVSHAIEWQASNGTCASPKEPEAEKSMLDTTSFKGLLSSVGKQVVDQVVEKKKAEKRRELALAPIFNYVETVESITIEDLHSSKLDVPARFKLISRK